MPPENSPTDSTQPTPVPEPTPVTTEPVLTSPEVAAEHQTAQVSEPTAQIPADEPLGSPEIPENTVSPAPPITPPVSVFAPMIQTARDLAVKARAVIQQRKQKKLEKILFEIKKKGSITNDEVEKILRVSDATATRYLSQLEKEGKIQQMGKTGKGVEYQKL